MHITLFVHAIQCTNDAVIKYGWSTQPIKRIYKLHPQIYLENLIVHRFFPVCPFPTVSIIFHLMCYLPWTSCTHLSNLFIYKIQNYLLSYVNYGLKKLVLITDMAWILFTRQDKQSSDICPHKVNKYRSS